MDIPSFLLVFLKEQLNMFLAQKFIKRHEHKSQLFVVTFQERILTNRLDYMNDTSTNYCTAEEADPRLLLHAIHQASTGLKNTMIETVDTDVLLLEIALVN